MDLVQQLVDNLGAAKDASEKTETKMLELLEKQTRLQEMSIENEREFLSVFKNYMDNMTSNP